MAVGMACDNNYTSFEYNKLLVRILNEFDVAARAYEIFHPGIVRTFHVHIYWAEVIGISCERL